jgi:hypothetical protein
VANKEEESIETDTQWKGSKQKSDPQNGEKMSQSISETVGKQPCQAPKAKKKIKRRQKTAAVLSLKM